LLSCIVRIAFALVEVKNKLLHLDFIDFMNILLLICWLEQPDLLHGRLIVHVFSRKLLDLGIVPRDFGASPFVRVETSDVHKDSHQELGAVRCEVTHEVLVHQDIL